MRQIEDSKGVFTAIMGRAVRGHAVPGLAAPARAQAPHAALRTMPAGSSHDRAASTPTGHVVSSNPYMTCIGFDHVSSTIINRA